MTNERVFPACAGVIPLYIAAKQDTAGFPRMRGGDPLPELRPELKLRFSPHARG